MINSLTILVQAAALAASAPATIPGNTSDALFTLDGEWSGDLEYRDYQTDELQAIPMRVDIDVIPDDLTMIQRFSFVDPRAAVYSTSLLAVSDDQIDVAASRSGRPFEGFSQTGRLVNANDNEQWTVLLTRIDSDAGRPAAIRETVSRDGDVLVFLKEVDFLDDNATEWTFRNRATLTYDGE